MEAEQSPLWLAHTGRHIPPLWRFGVYEHRYRRTLSGRLQGNTGRLWLIWLDLWRAAYTHSGVFPVPCISYPATIACNLPMLTCMALEWVYMGNYTLTAWSALQSLAEPLEAIWFDWRFFVCWRSRFDAWSAIACGILSGNTPPPKIQEATPGRSQPLKHLKFQKALLSHLPQSFLTALVSPTMRSITMIREITPQIPQTPCRALQKPCDWFHQIRHTVGQDRQGLPDKERQLSMNTNSWLLYSYRVQNTCFCLLIARKRQYLFVRKDI